MKFGKDNQEEASALSKVTIAKDRINSATLCLPEVALNSNLEKAQDTANNNTPTQL